MATYPLAKEIAVQLTQRLAPDDTDALEDGFDLLAANHFQLPETDPRHRFDVPQEVISYGLVIAVFIGQVFQEAAKDMVKEKLAQLLGKWLTQKQQIDSTEKAQLVAGIAKEIEKSKLPVNEKVRLQNDISRLLEKYPDGSFS